MGEFPKGGYLVLRAVADTHAVIWYIFGDARLSVSARNTIEQIAAEGNQVAFSSITLAEIVYLSERGRIDAATIDRLLRAVDGENAVLAEVPFDRNIAQSLMRVERSALRSSASLSQIPDLPDPCPAKPSLLQNGCCRSALLVDTARC